MLILVLVLVPVVFSAAAVDPPLKKVSLMPIWKHQAQFAGYYVAREKGIYAKHGIDLTVLNGGGDLSAEQCLENGTADFAVLWLTTALQRYAAGSKLVNVAQIVRRSSMVLIAKKNSGIKTVRDMQNRKIGVWDNDLNLPARLFFNKYGLHMKIVPGVQTVNLFLRGGIDVASAMWYNEYHTILASGINPDELNVFFLNEHGITFPEDGLYLLEKNYRRDPRLAEAFAKASLEGWRYAFNHPDEAIDIVIRYMKKENIPANRAHQKWMLTTMRDLIIPDNNDGNIGQLNISDYNGVSAEMRNNGLIKVIPAFDDFVGRTDDSN